MDKRELKEMLERSASLSAEVEKALDSAARTLRHSADMKRVFGITPHALERLRESCSQGQMRAAEEAIEYVRKLLQGKGGRETSSESHAAMPSRLARRKPDFI